MKLAFVLFCGAALGGAAFGSTAFYIIEKDHRFEQDTSSGVVTNGFDFIASVNPSATFDGGTLSVPGTSTLAPSVTLTNFGSFLEYPDVVPDLATYNARYPTGTYTFNVTDSGNSANNTSVSITDSSETFNATAPQIDAATFNALAGGIDPTQAFTFNYNASAFTPATSPFNASLIFLEILDLGTGNVPVVDGVQANVSSITVNPNQLAPGTNYEWVLFYQNAIVGTNTQFETDVRTRGFFTTQSATPEPASFLLIALGAGALAAFKRKLRRD